jgi:lactose/L-arabinose transport system permease protein
MIPLFQLFAQVGMINSSFAVILPAIATPFLVMLFRQSSRSFPHEIVEAARIDGLSELNIFARIYVPTMRSTYAAAAVITFMAAWNNFLWPKVIIVNNTYQTMPMLISNLRAGYVTDYGVLMLAVLVASLPTMVIFLILQRSFAEGMTGAIK